MEVKSAGSSCPPPQMGKMQTQVSSPGVEPTGKYGRFTVKVGQVQLTN